MNLKPERPVALIILDGWGLDDETKGNAIAAAHTPNYDAISANYPRTRLAASGAEVGLEPGQAGNAELGHLNIGAGRIVKTVQSRIKDAISNGSFGRNEVLRGAIASARQRGAAVHLIGLLSNAEVHASMESLYSLLRIARTESAENVFVHGILDGRDVPQRSADIFVEALEIKMSEIGVGRIASLCGRFYAMDSTESWERTARAFTMLIHAEGERANDPAAAVRSSFLRGISEEFIPPIVIEREPGVPAATIADGDLVVFFNHRPDTMRQLVRSVAVPDMGRTVASGKPRIEAVCLTEYDRAFTLPVAFPPIRESRGLAEMLAEHGINNFRISETERIPHITRFFDCETEPSSIFEHVYELPSASISIRESEPEMMSFKIADRFFRGMDQVPGGVFVVNIPAPGLVAETGDLKCAVEAVQYVDTCLGGVVDAVRKHNGVAMITSSHGNCERMLGPDGQADRGATTNAVPFHLIDTTGAAPGLRQDGALQDIAPTVLGILGIPQPVEMTGSDLRSA
jgi:2,3-bisphosphoglycerate-independent phosphoglycerate mutase